MYCSICSKSIKKSDKIGVYAFPLDNIDDGPLNYSITQLVSYEQVAHAECLKGCVTGEAKKRPPKPQKKSTVVDDTNNPVDDLYIDRDEFVRILSSMGESAKRNKIDELMVKFNPKSMDDAIKLWLKHYKRK